MEISGKTTATRVPGVVEADVAAGRVLLNGERQYLNVQGVGLRIWELLEQPRTVDALVATLLEEYDVEPDACAAQVGDFLIAASEHRVVALA